QPLTGIARRPDDDSSGPVSEEHGDVASAVAEVEPGRVNLGPDEQDVLVDTGPNPRIRDRQAVQEPGALISYVECGHAPHAELVAEEAPRSREVEVGREGGEHDGIDVPLAETSVLERHLAGRYREVAGSDAAL